MSAADEAAVARVRDDRRRGERAMVTLDTALRAAGIDGFASSYDWEAGRVTIRFDTPTDAYLAATRLSFLRSGDHVGLHNAFDRGRRLGRTEACQEPVAGEGEPEHYEAVDAEALADDWRALAEAIQEGRATAPSIRDWAEAHTAFRAKHGHGANHHDEEDQRELRAYVLANLRPERRTGPRTWELPANHVPWHGRTERPVQEETGRRTGW